MGRNKKRRKQSETNSNAPFSLSYRRHPVKRRGRVCRSVLIGPGSQLQRRQLRVPPAAPSRDVASRSGRDEQADERARGGGQVLRARRGCLGHRRGGQGEGPVLKDEVEGVGLGSDLAKSKVFGKRGGRGER